MVTLSFNDGYASAYKYGLLIVDAAGLKCTDYIITLAISEPGYVTKEEVLAMQAKGHEIGAHTRTHPHLPEFNPAQQKAEICR